MGDILCGVCESELPVMSQMYDYEKKRADKYKDLHDLAKGRLNDANELISKLEARNAELEGAIRELIGVCDRVVDNSFLYEHCRTVYKTVKILKEVLEKGE